MESRRKRWMNKAKLMVGGKVSREPSPGPNTEASKSAISLPPGPASCKPDTTTLTLHNNHASGAAPTSMRTNMQDPQKSSGCNVGTEQPPKPVIQLTAANTHQSIATTDPAASTIPSSIDLQVAEIHDMIVDINKKLEGKECGERMQRIVGSLEKCAKIVDVAIQHHPDIVALVWAGARSILMVGPIEITTRLLPAAYSHYGL